MSETNFSLVEILRQVFRRMKFILLFTLICIIAGVIFSYIAPKKYTSKTSFILKSPLFIDRNQLFRQADYQNKPFFAGEDDIDHILTISLSDTLMGYLVNKFNLKDHYKSKSYNEAIGEAHDNFKLKRSDTKNLEIYFTDTDPVLAAQLTASVTEQIGRMFSNSFTETNKDVINSLKHKITTLDDTLRLMDDAIKSMRVQYGVYDKLLPVRGEHTLSESSGQGTSPVIAEGLEKIQELAVLKDKFTEDRARYYSLINEFSVGLQDDNINMLFVVQPARVPTVPSSPIIGLIAGICALGGFFFGSLLVVFSAFYRINFK